MANRLVLVPEDLYRGLLTAPTKPLALDNDDIGAQYTKRKMFAARRSKTLNASARNTLYQQELRRLLISFLAQQHVLINIWLRPRFLKRQMGSVLPASLQNTTPSAITFHAIS
ncbi:hypothetical protein DdX_16267 [Ditylenchus destructor]|uniref:Uncharacterized protein n=1 Tax=Ditylenchus destructor TaxID=166010 RepID=A0AAD4MQQ2_9BILA|nr:hypothetical protein DdX_16267 [Ditylenchus destructor]